VHFQHAARREPAKQRLAHLLGVYARLLRKRERFGDDAECAGDHHLIADLAELACARLADADDLLGIAHHVENRFDRLECIRIAANHDRQRAADGADFAAAHRRIEHQGAERLRLRGKAARDSGRDAAVVDDDRSSLQRAEDAICAFEHLFDVR
jgi:hypothetical protein